MKRGKRGNQFIAALLSALLIAGSVAGPVFGAETAGCVVEESSGIEEVSAESLETDESEVADSSEEDIIDEESAEEDESTMDEKVTDKTDVDDDQFPAEKEQDLEEPESSEDIESIIEEVQDDAQDSESSEEAQSSENSDETDPAEAVIEEVQDDTQDLESSEEEESAEAVIEEAKDAENSENTEPGEVSSDAASESSDKITLQNQDGDSDNDDKPEDINGSIDANDSLIQSEQDAQEVVSSDAMMDVVSSGTYGDNLTWTLDDQGTLTISGTGEMSNNYSSYDIPWNSSRSSIKTVIIEDGVTSIGNVAFWYCSNLTSITIPSSVSSIGNYAFYGCSSLASITLPEGLTSIGKEAFYGCSSLTNVTIPNSVTDIGEYTFFNCSSLTSIQILDGVMSIGNYAFSNCSSLTSITIPGSVTSFGNYAFSNCSSLTSIQIPDSVTSIGVSAFYGCSSLITIEVDSNNSHFSSLDGVLFNKKQTMLIICPKKKSGNYLIPDTVTTIGEDAFYSTNLTSITIPESVTRISYYAFADCSNLSDVYYTGSRDRWDQVYIYNSGNDRLLYEGVHCAGDIEVAEISLDKTSATLIKGGTLQLSFTVAPTNATVQSVSWNCSDEDVASVNKDGLVRGYRSGTATITATAMDGSGVTATCTVTVVNNDLCAFAEGTEENYVYVGIPVGETSELRVTVSAIDDSELSCQWYKYDWNEDERIAIQGATGLSYTVESADERYYFEVRDQYGNWSEVVFYTSLENNLQAYVEGTDRSEVELYLAPDESVELHVTVSAIDESELSFQWYSMKGKAIEGATGTSYTIDPVTGQTQYEFRVSDQYGSIAYARFYVNIRKENHLRAYAEGTEDTEAYLYSTPGESSELQVTVSADDESKLSFQWYKLVADYSGKLDSYPINGATGASYTVNSVTGFERYICEVEDQYHNLEKVSFYTCIADFDGAQTIACGDEVSASANSEAGGGAYPVYRFIPAETAKYVMYSTDGVGDPYLEILKDSHDSLVRTASSFEDPAIVYDGKGHFRVEQVLEAGKTYYLVFGTYSYSSSCVLHLENAGLAVTEIKLNKTSASLEATKTLQLTASVLPDDATDKSITWSSSNTKVATVDSNGEVKGVSAGTTTITATAADGSGVTATCIVTVHGISVANAIVSGLTAQTYTGKVLTPTPNVVLNSTTLKLDTDYKLSYSNNIDVGTATITITGMGNYTGTATATFKINAASISSVTVSGLSAKTYTGSAITQTPTVKNGTTTLKSGTDYTVSYTNNTNAGTATVKITGKGNYTGTKTATFTINKAAQSITAKSSAASVAVGKTATVTITGAKGTKSYKSSNTAVATVTSAGKVTAKKVGAVTITATSGATTNYKAASKTVTIKVVPAATTSLTAANQATGIKLTWEKVTGANGYKVYRGSTLVKTITSGSTVTYTDTKANTNGTKYTFKVVAKAATGDSTLSKSLTTYRVARPAISSATNSAASKMTVKWAKNAKATGYQIQYSTSKTFASGNKAVSVTSASTVSKAIAGLTKGKTYYVRIRTYKTVGSTKYWSAWSVAKTVKITK